MSKDTGIGSYSYANRADLPGGEPGFYASAPKARDAFDNARDPLIAAQKRDMDKSEAQRRFELTRRDESGSRMVQQDQPKPVLKPSPALSMGPDRLAFTRAWTDEHRAARKRDQDARAETPPSMPLPPPQKIRVTFGEIQAREDFIESRRTRAKRKRNAQSHQ